MTNRKCICRKVKSAWRMGWAMRMSSTQDFSMVACIAISRPAKIRVPRPIKKAEQEQIVDFEGHVFADASQDALGAVC